MNKFTQLDGVNDALYKEYTEISCVHTDTFSTQHILKHFN